MQDVSGSISEQDKEVTGEGDLESSISKARLYARFQVALCILIWFSSFLAYMGAEWLHTRQQPRYMKVNPRPQHSITSILRTSGAISVLTGNFGWWGTFHERYGSILTFSAITFLSSVVEISCGSVILSYAGKITLLMKEDVSRNLKQVTDPMASELTDNFLELQQKLNCCGVHSYKDWIESPWWNSQRQINSSSVIPSSCCVYVNQKQQDCFTGEHPYTDVNNTDFVHKVGCLEEISQYMDFLFYITGSLAFIGGTLKFFGFFLLNIFGNLILSYKQQIDQEGLE